MSDFKFKAESDDLSLLRLSGVGDKAAFDFFVRRHQAAVYRFAKAVSGSDTQAEEVLQGTFIEAWRGAAGFSGDGSARSWLFTIARRNSAKLRRKRSGQPDVFEDIATLGVSAGWGSDCGDFRARLESRQWIGKSLSRLRESEQEILLCIELEGFTLEEAALALGITKAAAKSRLHRARLNLLTKLHEENDIEE